MGETMAAALIRTGSITTTLDGSNKGVLEPNENVYLLIVLSKGKSWERED